MKVSRLRGAKQALSVSAFILTLSLGQFPPEIVDFPRQFMMDVAAAPAAPLNSIASVLGQIAGTGPSSKDLEQEVRQLTERLAAAQGELARARELIASFERFRSVPGRAGNFVWSSSIRGYIVGGDTDPFTRSYVADIGSRDGVARGMPVVWANIALGVISDVGLWHSRVRVLSDPRSRICIRFPRTGREGVLAGTGRASCEVRFVPNQVDDYEIQVGDIVVTSGTDALFPPGLEVGKVTRFSRRPAQPAAEVEVELRTDLSRIQTCLVLKEPAQDLAL